MNTPPQQGTDWSSTAEVAPAKKSGCVRLLIWGAALLALLLMASCMGFFTWIIVNSPPEDVIEGGSETEEMRELFEDYGLLDAEEELLWCHFAGTSLEEKGCLLTDRRVGVFYSAVGESVTWGSPVVSSDYADITSIEVTWSRSSFLPCSPVRVHVDDATWLQFELCGNQEKAARFMEDFERLCEEQSPGFEGVFTVWDEDAWVISPGADLYRGEGISEEQLSSISQMMELGPEWPPADEQVLWYFIEMEEDSEEGGFLSDHRVGCYSSWEGTEEGETGIRDLADVVEVWYSYGEEEGEETTVYIDTGEPVDLVFYLSPKDALDRVFLADLDRLCVEQAGDHYAGLVDLGEESEEFEEEEEEEEEE